MNVVQKLIEADRVSPKLILVVGDGMTDIYIHGRLEDSCQEGCQKFVEKERVVVPGGAANAARSLKYWRTEVPAFYAYGPKGPIKTRFMDVSRCTFRHDNDYVDGNQSSIRQGVIDALRSSIPFDALLQPSAVLLSDYDKGMLTPEFIKEIVETCKRLGIPCVADVKRAPETYQGAILKGNVDWIERHRYSPDVLTRGEKQPIVDGYWFVGLSNPVPCVNHVGSGDCFAAHLTLALAHGFSLRDAAAIAHSAGRVYVQFPHNRPPRPDEIAEDMGSA